MRVVRGDGGSPRQAPQSPGPTVETLIDEAASGGQLTVTQVVVPAGGDMREHDHGESQALLVPLAGELVITSGSHHEIISLGTVALLERGERVRLTNQTSEPCTVVMVFTPGDARTGTILERNSGQTAGKASAGMRWVPAGPVDQLDDDAAVHMDLAGHPVCVARSDGMVYAMLDECSHGQVELSEGDVADGHVECWLHGSRFALATGLPTGPPATQAVPVYPVRITAAGIEVALPATPEGGPYA